MSEGVARRVLTLAVVVEKLDNLEGMAKKLNQVLIEGGNGDKSLVVQMTENKLLVEQLRERQDRLDAAWGERAKEIRRFWYSVISIVVTAAVPGLFALFAVLTRKP